MGWSVFLLAPGLGLAGARARSAPGPGRALGKITFPKLPMYTGWCGCIGRCQGVLTLGKVAAPSSPKHLLSHFPWSLFANSFELSFA